MAAAASNKFTSVHLVILNGGPPDSERWASAAGRYFQAARDITPHEPGASILLHAILNGLTYEWPETDYSPKFNRFDYAIEVFVGIQKVSNSDPTEVCGSRLLQGLAAAETFAMERRVMLASQTIAAVRARFRHIVAGGRTDMGIRSPAFSDEPPEVVGLPRVGIGNYKESEAAEASLLAQLQRWRTDTPYKLPSGSGHLEIEGKVTTDGNYLLTAIGKVEGPLSDSGRMALAIEGWRVEHDGSVSGTIDVDNPFDAARIVALTFLLARSASAGPTSS